ncbi:MAG: hypothetical protein EA361_17460 [Bacteroidetes bacterium]|nr:MAG: hypothetical protein EA361_17460 [Bacteroidota bacterium]
MPLKKSFIIHVIEAVNRLAGNNAKIRKKQRDIRCHVKVKNNVSLLSAYLPAFLFLLYYFIFDDA